MARHIIFCGIILVFPILLLAQSRITYNGYIEDAHSGERLIGAIIKDTVSNAATVSNNYGYFSLSLSKQASVLQFHYLGYAPLVQSMKTDEPGPLHIKLTPSDIFLESITITDRPPEDSIIQIGQIKLSPQQIEQIPVLLGETDVIKAIQLLPGIQGGQEGTSGLYVRGGGPDQNLILIDGVPVYNISHLFGFFSIFNNDAINDVKVWKGGFPAQYGERLSSVIDISMKEGNNQKFSGRGSIGLLSSKFLLEGPLESENTSFILSGRRTYFDLFTGLGQQIANGGDAVTGYFFQDFNAKINHRISNKDRIYLSFYGGKDSFFNRENYQSNDPQDPEFDKIDVGLNWGNLIGVLRWNRILTPRLFLNASLTYSQYNFEVFERYESGFLVSGEPFELQESSEYHSGIRDLAFKMDFDWFVNNEHQIKFGTKVVDHIFDPGVFQLSTNRIRDSTYGASELSALEWAAYAESSNTIGENFSYSAGLRYAAYEINNRLFSSFQPRINLKFSVNDRISFQSAYSRMQQFIHLLTNTGVGLPTDLWVPATERAKPQKAEQFSLGTTYAFGPYLLSIDGYLKKIKNVLNYRDGATFFNASDNWEDNIVTGEGISTGIELLIKKTVGKTNGWIGYTLAKSDRRFDELNFGRSFPFRYDRRHDISLVINHTLRKGAVFSFSWIFQSGNPITIPTSFQPYLDNFNRRFDFRESNANQGLPSINTFLESGDIGLVQFFPDRNNIRLRATHRLDLGVRFTKQKKRMTRTWSFGLYNTYSRQNPFYVDWQFDRNGDLQLIQHSLFPVLPYLSYGFKF